ncbi:glycerol-3-phosphate dehydrogenase [Babesia caballi]|uniref:Glycerol-3-phosphate dehydrogenase n=1 Tax=Babesia caballi TaxID=5871 RepID=A0AAV4LP67_BABCB|nr:glycerol-3-phosphate dehydrogenase [Babesia caballi]
MDPCNNFVIYVNPLQYERIRVRREERDRLYTKRGRPLNTYVPLAVRLESPSMKRSRYEFEAPDSTYGYVGYASQAYGLCPSTHYLPQADYGRVVSHISLANENASANFSDVATLIGGVGDRSSYTGSVISGSTSNSRGSELSPNKDRSPCVATNLGDNVLQVAPGMLGETYMTVHHSNSADSTTGMDRMRSDAYASAEPYQQMHVRRAKRNYVLPRMYGVAESFSSTSSMSSSSMVVGSHAPSSSGAAMAIPVTNSYSSVDNVATVVATPGELYAPTKLGSTSYVNGSYSAETCSGESCCSDVYAKDGYAQQGESRCYYTTTGVGCNTHVSEYCATGAYGDAEQVDIGGGELSCGYAQHVVGSGGTYPAHAVSHGAMVKPAGTVQPVIQGPVYNEYVYVTGTDAKV